MAPKNTADHWAFLEEIDAPMWVDLALEAKCNSKNIDDEWFHTSHPFHQCSSRKIKAAFALSDEVRMPPEFDIKGPSSPKSPSSVSRSRGKDSGNKKCRVEICNLSLNKQHPIKVLKKSSWVNSGLGEEIKPKLSFINSKGMSKRKKSLVSDGLAGNENNLKYKGKCSWVNSGSEEEKKLKLSFINSKRISRPEISLLSDTGSLSSLSSMVDKPGESNTSTSTSDGNQHYKFIFSRGGSQSNSSSMVDKTDESNTSSITFEGNQQLRQKNVEVSSQAFGYKSGFLSTPRISLGKRKSRVSRQASRMEIKRDKGESRDRKSSCSKSSVGSSSNAGYDVKSSTSTVVEKKETTPDSQNIMRVTKAAKKKSIKSVVCEGSNAQVKGVVYESGNTRKVVKSACQEAAKSKAQNQTIHPKALQEHRFNRQGPLIVAVKVEKIRSEVPNILGGAGKKNATETVPICKKGRSGSIASIGMARDQKVLKKQVLQMVDRTALVGPKEKNSSTSKEKLASNVTKTVHLR